MEGENKESVPEFKEEIVILDKPGVIRGGRPKNPKIKGKKKILGKIGLKENPPMSLETPQISLETPQIIKETPQIIKETPQISIETPQISVEAPQISIETPQISIEKPQISLETHQISLETPQISLETPQISLVTPIKSKQSNAEFLVDSIVKTYWTTKWREQLIIMKFAKTGFNRKRGDFRSFCMKLDHSMKYHQYLNIIKLFDKMDKLPKKEDISHNDFYGKIKLISKREKRNEIKEIKNEENIIIINNDIGNNIKINIDLDLPIIENKEEKKEEEFLE
jgi:hypothetical protein